MCLKRKPLNYLVLIAFSILFGTSLQADSNGNLQNQLAIIASINSSALPWQYLFQESDPWFHPSGLSEDDPMTIAPNGVDKKIAAILDTGTVVSSASAQMVRLQALIEQQLGITIPNEQEDGKLQPRLPVLLYQSKNKDFLNHIGWQLEVDAVWWHQSKGIK